MAATGGRIITRLWLVAHICHGGNVTTPVRSGRTWMWDSPLAAPHGPSNFHESGEPGPGSLVPACPSLLRTPRKAAQMLQPADSTQSSASRTRSFTMEPLALGDLPNGSVTAPFIFRSKIPQKYPMLPCLRCTVGWVEPRGYRRRRLLIPTPTPK